MQPRSSPDSRYWNNFIILSPSSSHIQSIIKSFQIPYPNLTTHCLMSVLCRGPCFSSWLCCSKTRCTHCRDTFDRSPTHTFSWAGLALPIFGYQKIQTSASHSNSTCNLCIPLLFLVDSLSGTNLHIICT